MTDKIRITTQTPITNTVAVSDGQLFMRTASFLWAIGNRKTE